MNLSTENGLTAIGGVVAILFGLILLSWPGLTIGLFLILFVIYLIIYGIFRIISSLRAENKLGGMSVGVLSVIAGLVLFVWPGLTVTLLFYIIAAYLLLSGIFELISAFSFGQTNWWLLVAGGLNVILSIYIIFNFAVGALTLIYLIGIYNILLGIVLLVNGFVKPLPRTASF